MKRGSFKRPQIERKPRAPLVPRDTPVRATMQVPALFRPIPKVRPVRSEPYRRYVAQLPCYRCGVSGITQACHGDQDKGMATKTSDLTCWPGCGPDHMGNAGCHDFVGRKLDKEARRAFELRAAADTREALILKSRADPKLHALLVKLEIV